MSKRGKRRGKTRGVSKKHLRGAKAQNSIRRANRPSRKPRPARPQTARGSSRPAPSSSGSQELRSAISMLETRERGLQNRVHLSSIEAEINQIDNAFLEIPAKIAELNKRGFVFTKDMDDALTLAEEEWNAGIEDDVEAKLTAGINEVQQSANRLDRAMAQLVKPNQYAVEKAENELDQLDNLISATEKGIRGRYSAIKTTIDEIYGDIDEANWGIDHLNDSEIKLRGSEALVQVAEAEWEIDGEDEGPDGFLYLTDQRLLFEQKEEVAEKKFMFITTKSTEVQKLLIDTELRYLGTIEQSEEKRRRLQWGSDEILSMTVTGQADLSRLRFHIKNQQAEDWKETLQFVLSGEIQEDRFDHDPEAAEEKLVFPTSCPNCMAAVPPLPGGVSVHECEFCGTTIQASDE